MTDEEQKPVLTDPQSAISRIAALERQVELLITLAYAVHGARWMDELKDKNEPARGE